MMTTVKRMAVCLAVVAVSMGVLGCESEEEMVLPEGLIGTWKTTAPAYAGRSLRVTRATVAFGAVDGIEPSHLIQRVTSVREHDAVLYTITYAGPVDETVSFYYDPAGGGTITLKNQRQFQWKKEG